MKKHFVIDPLIGKRQQLLLATQLCRMVLKVRFKLLRVSSSANVSYCIIRSTMLLLQAATRTIID